MGITRRDFAKLEIKTYRCVCGNRIIEHTPLGFIDGNLWSRSDKGMYHIIEAGVQ